MAIPAETPRPLSIRSVPLPLAPAAMAPVSVSLFIEAAGDELGEGVHRSGRLGALGAELDDAAGSCRQHHQPHDRDAGDARAVLVDLDLGVELLGKLDELGGGSGMESAAVADRHLAGLRRRAPVVARF